MAQKILTILEDDLDGGKADETVVFSLDGSAYEIDLSSKNAQKLRDAFAPFVSSARKAGARSGPGRGRGGRGGRGSGGPDPAEVRAWAREQGLNVSERGRVSGEILEKYRAAH